MSPGRGRNGRDARTVDASAGTLTAALYESYGGRVYGLCARRLGVDEAADAVQDTFLRAWLAIQGGVEVRHPLPWLLTIADNVCVSRFRARSARVVTTELSDAASVEPSEPSGELAGLTAALRELPETQREALLRREVQGLSYDEIGAALGVSRASVAALIHRGRRAVVESLRGARRGLPAFVPLPWILRLTHTGHAGSGAGAAAAASTVAVTVAVAQLAGPPPLAVPDARASVAPRIELSAGSRSTGPATPRIRATGARRDGAHAVIETTPVDTRPEHSTRPEHEPEMPTWSSPVPRTDGLAPTVAPEERPTDSTPGSPPEDESPSPSAPPPVWPPATPGADDPADEGSEAETDEGDVSAAESEPTEPEDGGSPGRSESAPGHGGSGPPGGGNGNGHYGTPGPPEHSNQGGNNAAPGPPQHSNAGGNDGTPGPPQHSNAGGNDGAPGPPQHSSAGGNGSLSSAGSGNADGRSQGGPSHSSTP